jgi:hypothetical protein
MHVVARLTRGAAGTLAVAALLAVTGTACAGPPGAPRAGTEQPGPSGGTDPGRPDGATGRPGGATGQPDSATGRPDGAGDRGELQRRALALLSDPDELPTGEFVLSGSSADPGTATQSDVLTPGESLVVEVSCVGPGTAVFTMSSGGTVVRQRVDCTAPRERIVQLSTAGHSLVIEVARQGPGPAAVAYLVRRAG